MNNIFSKLLFKPILVVVAIASICPATVKAHTTEELLKQIQVMLAQLNALRNWSIDRLTTKLLELDKDSKIFRWYEISVLIHRFEQQPLALRFAGDINPYSTK